MNTNNWRGLKWPQGVFALAFLAIPALAYAAGATGEGPSESLFILQIVILVVVGRLLGELMVRIGQPSILGQIIGGVLLGPSVFGALFPDLQAQLFPGNEAQSAMTNAVGQIGILMLLLLAGMETDLGLAIRLRKAAAAVSLMGIVIPFACGFALGELMPIDLVPDPDKRIVTSLFLGTALSISSVKIVASVVREMNFMRRNVGQLIVGSAIIDDTIGWVIIAVTFSLARSGSIDIPTVVKSVAGTLIFMAVSFTIGRRLVFRAIRFTNDHFKSDLPVLSAIIAIMGLMAIITDMIGVHTVLGAFVAGILVGESPILTRQIDTQLRALTNSLFMPVFFGLTGLHTDLSVLGDPETLILAIGLIVIASIGKFGGAFAGARISGYSRAEAIALGSGMNARGSTEVIVASIGLSVGVLDERLFSVIVAMAIVTTMAMPPSLRWALARLPMREEEQHRLQHEGFEENSFIAQFERILLTVDKSASGRLAARLAGYFVASRGMPVSVLSAREDEETGKNEAEVKDGAIDIVATKAKDSIESDNDTGDQTTSDIHVSALAGEGELLESLRGGAEKGHDLLFAGMEPMMDEKGGFSARTTELSGAFSGTTALISSRGTLNQQADADLRILVPFSGTRQSTNAVEFALVIAKASGCSVGVLSITEPRADTFPRLSDVPSQEKSVFSEVDALAKYYDVSVHKITQQGGSPEVTILRHARRGRYNLIIMGVTHRSGEKLSYGRIADTVSETADRSIVLIEAK
ncbi:cation:proton antiporter [Rhizobium sp. L1K21]|uniref:cation:proton antiporter domain-containing protein n=1 Tax=Rhizobium sp. L1K21 TaxID=2954933 RepID=UPI002093F046|nr:cation:proton antiporter [Rhizobium sp. L1K21]MCO6184682.1 cation:proton antiporter [Rhizobium sp. L1K21]